MSDGMRIVHLQVADVLRLRALEIVPDDSGVVTLGGRNAQGKTSVLEAIRIGLGGKKCAPPSPVRDGARRGEIVLNLGELEVIRSISAGGTHTLTVRGKDGRVHERPQAMLDRLYATVAMDPLAFAQQPARQQAETLRSVIGLDFGPLEGRRKSLFEERTENNRALRDLEGQLRDAPTLARTTPSGARVPDAEVSMDAAAADLEAAQRDEGDAQRCIDRADSAAKIAESAAAEVERLQQQLRDAQGRSMEAAQDAEEARRAAPTTLDLESLGARVKVARDTLRDVEVVNRLVRANLDRRALEAEVAAQAKGCEELTAQIEALDAEKARMMAEAQFPIDGLGIEEDGVTLNGLPLEQASQAERIRLGVAIAAALNPDLRVVLVRDGSLLDPRSLADLVALAREHDCQLWIEDARTIDPAAIIIEDGEAETRAAKETP